MAYQPALDGVRALAVVAVLLFHAEVPGVSGGYLGVSVFFTLSGFLITSLLVAERARTGTVDAAAFYARRARRLLPASLLCVGLISVASVATDWFDGVANLRRDLLGAVLQVANWVFLFGGGSYQELFAQASGAVSPVEHYWSLAIEEQFYWVWPVAFVGVARLARGRGAGLIGPMAALTLVFAIAAPVIAAVWGPDAAYWATPARVAEILMGALLAVVLAGRRIDPRWRWAAGPCLAALGVACVVVPGSGGPAYVGALPLFAVVSAMLLLGLQVDGPVRRALAVAPLVHVGRVSYGVYLFHWPLFVVLTEERTGLDGVGLFAVRMAATFALAEVSFRVLEQPIRTGVRLTSRRTLAAGAGLTASIAAVAIVLVPSSIGDYWEVADDRADAASIQPSDRPLATLAPVVTIPDRVSAAPSDSVADPSGSAPTTSPAPLPMPSRPVRIVVAGDSTAQATGAGLVEWAATNPELAQVELWAAPGCGFLRGGDLPLEGWTPVAPACDRWIDDELPAAVSELQPDVVMAMTTSWDVLDRRWPETGPVSPTDEVFRARLEQDFAAISAALLEAGAAQVVWVRQPVPNVYWQSTGQAQEQPDRHDVLHEAMQAVAEQDERITVVDLDDWLAATGLDVDRSARPDGVHWSPEAATTIAADFLGAQLVRAALA
jgi:peptidoglycan/LPS O-acetylase OafA/YrhL